MLKVRAEQAAAIERGCEERFLRDAIAWLRGEAPEVVEDATPAELDAFARESLRRARSHGFHEGPEIRQFMLFAAWRGPAFDEEPWAKEILADPRRSRPLKLALLEDHILTIADDEAAAGE